MRPPLDDPPTCLLTDAACTPDCPCVNCRRQHTRSEHGSTCEGKPHIAWECSSCGKSGQVWSEHETAISEVADYVFAAHFEDSPKCRASRNGSLVFWAQIEAGRKKR